MSERFNVAGALLVKLFGRPADEDAEFRRKARRVADIGVQQAMYARIFLVSLSLVAALRHGARLRPRRPARDRGHR